MIKLVIGVLLGACVTYVLMNGTGDIAQKAKDAVHDAAASVAEATEPSTTDKLGDLLNSLVK
jgi:hypothetical protein